MFISWTYDSHILLHHKYEPIYKSRDGSVSLVTTLGAGQPMNRGSIPGDRHSSLVQNDHTSSGANPLNGYWGSLPGG
jgi:hypothetical protein